jgi:hypothetical protein
MSWTKPLGYALSGSAILTLLAGCSGGGSSSTPTPVSPAAVMRDALSRSIGASSGRNADPTSVLLPGVERASRPDRSAGFADVDAAAKAALIVSDSGTGDVDVFSTKGKVVATITGFAEPQGMTGTKAGSFYVANTAASNIPLYRNDYKTLIATLSDPNEYPVDVSYEESAGVVAVTNIVSTSNGAGSVSFYAKGKTTPCVTIGSSAWHNLYFDAFDSKGNLFIDGLDNSGNGLVGEIAGGCSAKTITTLKLGNSVAFPGPIQVTNKDDIVIDDQGTTTIYTYKPPVKGSLGKPIATTPLGGASDPTAFAFTSSGKDLWTVDAGLDTLDEYAYPAGGSPVTGLHDLGFVLPIGIVVTPVEAP